MASADTSDADRVVGEGSAHRTLRGHDRLALSVFTIALIGSCIPVKNVHYIIPWVLVAHLALSGRPRTLHRLLGAVAVGAVVSIGAAVVSMGSVNIPGVAWAALTYSPVLFLVVLDRDVVTDLSPGVVRTITDQVALVVILQAAIGGVQLAASGDPDAVAGTFDPTGFLTGVTISQLYLAVFLIGCVFFLAAVRTTLLHDVAIVAGILCLLISQSGHQTILAVASLALATILVAPTVKRVAGAVAFVGVATVAVRTLDPATSQRARGWYEKTVTSDQSLKRRAWSDAFGVVRELPETLVGYGAGQFSSRGGLIASGEYLSVSLPGALTGKSPVFARLVDPAVAEFERVGEGSAISKPYSSATSVLAEFGPVVFAAVATAAAVIIVRQLLAGHAARGHDRVVHTYVAAGAIFFTLLCLIENYLEFPQTFLVPGLLALIADRSVARAPA